MKYYSLIAASLISSFLAFSAVAYGQSWERIISDSLFKSQFQVHGAYPDGNGGVQFAVATNPLFTNHLSFISLDQNGVRKAAPSALNVDPTWFLLHFDNFGCSYWFGDKVLLKYSPDNQLEWSYSVAPTVPGSSYMFASSHGLTAIEHQDTSLENFIDMVDRQGHTLSKYTVPKFFDLIPQRDGLIIQRPDYFGTYQKLDKSGQIIWTRSLSQLGSMGEGGTDGAAYFLDGSYEIQRLDTAGNDSWHKKVTDYFTNKGRGAFGMPRGLSDGNVAVCATFLDSATLIEKPFLMKLNAKTGAAIWKTAIATKLPNSTFYSNPSVYEMPDGGVLTSFGIFKGSGDSFDLLVVRTDVNGNTLTNKVLGKLFVDGNTDCSLQPTEFPLNNITVFATSGTTVFSTTTDADGKFDLRTNAERYTLSMGQLGTYWDICDAPIIVEFASPKDSILLNIGAKPTIICPEMVVSIGSNVFRRCFENNSFFVKYQNFGTAPAVDSEVEVTLDPAMSFVSASAPLLGQAGQVLRFGIGKVEIGGLGYFSIKFKVDCDAVLGTVICAEAHVSPDSNCTQNSGRLAVSNSFCLPVVASFDPNDKTAFIDGRPEAAKISPDSSLEYLIRFQNTGNDTAFTVVILDTLSRYLDVASILPGAASHPYRFDLRDGRVLSFRFEQILLPDSTTNEEGSHGFVKFSARQNPGNPLGERLENKAYIYFDFNAPVSTNLTSLLFSQTLPPVDTVRPFSVRVWPMPTSDGYHVAIEDKEVDKVTWKIYSITGQLVADGVAFGPEFFIKRGMLPEGIYFCQFSNKNWRFTRRVIFYK